jgi:hypothetical protein
MTGISRMCLGRISSLWCAPISNQNQTLCEHQSTGCLCVGVHAILFLICMRILLGRRRSVMKTAMLIAVVVMFGLATGDVAVSWHIILGRTSILYTGTTTKLQHAIRPKLAIHFINKSVLSCPLMLIEYWEILKIWARTGFSAIADCLLVWHSSSYIHWPRRC